MADGADLLDRARAYLIAQGLVRHPNDAGVLPPIWIEPEGGAVAPGDKTPDEAAREAGTLTTQDNADLVVTAMYAGGPAAHPWDSAWRHDVLDFWLRARRAPFAFDKEAQLRAAFIGDIGKRDWSMAGLAVNETIEWRPLQPLRGIGGSSHTYVVSYLFDYSS